MHNVFLEIIFFMYLKVLNKTTDGLTFEKRYDRSVWGTVPTVDENNATHYVQVSDPKEQYMPSKLEDPSKRNHSMPFPPTAHTAFNVEVLITCSQCHKPRLIYSKHKLSGNQIT